MGISIRTLRLETSERVRSKAPCYPSSTGSSQKDIDAPISKEMCILCREGGMLGSYNRKKGSRMVVAKRKRGGNPMKME